MSTSPADGPTLDQVVALWSDLPGVSGLTKGMFAAGSVVAVAGGEVEVAVPNEVHRQKCEQKKGDVEAALSNVLGSAITLRLVADGAAAGGPGPGAGSSTSSEPESTFEDLGVDDVRDLPDAPDAAVGGVDALTEAFPGATFVEGS